MKAEKLQEPDMVQFTLPPRVAIACFVALVVGVVLCVAILTHHDISGRVEIPTAESSGTSPTTAAEIEVRGLGSS